jgi:SNF2 family DNA or RNA helicase
MIPDILTLPKKFRDLVANPPAGLLLSQRVLEPIIVVSKEQGQLRPRLAGRHLIKDREFLIFAADNRFDWVLDGTIARPLPSDIQEIIASRFEEGAKSNWRRELLKLSTRHDDVVKIRLSADLVQPGNVSACSFSSALPVPGLHAQLYPYQARGVAWMRETAENFGGLILADEMGLGKTLQIIALLLLNPPPVLAPALIVCPTSLIANWVREIKKFAPSLTLLVHRGPERAGVFTGLRRTNVVITTYDTMVNDIVLFSAFEWSWVICDEAQAIKNPESGRRQAVITVPRQRTIPMTGTPVENSLVDLWSLADFAVPGILGSLEHFKKEFPDSTESAAALRSIIDPIMIKRHVAEVADDLPERIDIDIPIEMEDSLVNHYNDVRKDTLQRYPVAGALVATLQLQLVCAHPWLRVVEDREDTIEHAVVQEQPGLPLLTSKMDVAVRIINEAFNNRRKVLVFSVFNRMGDLLRRAGTELPDAWWGSINGSTPQSDRQNIVDKFSDFDGPAILVLNPRAAGSGLNITAATVVIHITPVWNPALEAQASARAHRRGQTMPVTVYRLYYDSTVERVMIDRSAWKNSIGNEIAPLATRDAEDLTAALAITPGRKS